MKQMGPRHSSKTHTVLFCSFDTSFGYTLFIPFKIQLCSQVGNQSTQTETLSGDVLPLSERGWEREDISHLTYGWKKTYQKAKSLVSLHLRVFGQNFLGVYMSGITNSQPYTTMCLSSINSNHCCLIPTHSQ